MSIYQVTLRGNYYGQQIINVFSYVSAIPFTGTASAAELLEKMGFFPTGDPPVVDPTTLFGFLVGLTSTSLHFTEVEAVNLYDPTDFFLEAFSPAIDGEAAGFDMSPFTSYGLFSNRLRRDIRRGFKRFAGVLEEAVTNGGLITGAYVTQLDNTAHAMSVQLDGDDGAVYYPAVLSFEAYTTPKGNTAYKQRATEALQLEHSMYPIEWAAYAEIRSQVSRQYKRGR